MSAQKTPQNPDTRAQKSPPPQNFADPATGHILSMVLELMSELSVIRDRLDTVECLIADNGLFQQSDIDGYDVPENVASLRATRRTAYVERVMKSVRDDLDRLGTKGV